MESRLVKWFHETRQETGFELKGVVLTNGTDTLLVLEWWLLEPTYDASRLPRDVFVVYYSGGEIDNNLATSLEEEGYIILLTDGESDV